MNHGQTVYTLWLREIKRFQRNRSRLLGSMALPVLFLFVLGSGFGGSFRYRDDVSYMQFLGPGIIAMSLLFSSMFGGLSVLWDKQFGFLKEILVRAGEPAQHYGRSDARDRDDVHAQGVCLPGSTGGRRSDTLGRPRNCDGFPLHVPHFSLVCERRHSLCLPHDRSSWLPAHNEFPHHARLLSLRRTVSTRRAADVVADPHLCQSAHLRGGRDAFRAWRPVSTSARGELPSHHRLLGRDHVGRRVIVPQNVCVRRGRPQSRSAGGFARPYLHGRRRIGGRLKMSGASEREATGPCFGVSRLRRRYRAALSSVPSREGNRQWAR